MDAVNFIKTLQRFQRINRYASFSWALKMTPEELVQKMEQWAVEYPVKTRQSELLKILPNAALDERGVLLCDPCDFYDNMLDDCLNSCSDCRRAFWLEEMEE